MNKQTQFHIGYWLAAIIGILLLQHFYSISQRIEALPYSQFQQLLQEGNG
jgi:cell division protease FtsH